MLPIHFVLVLLAFGFACLGLQGYLLTYQQMMMMMMMIIIKCRLNKERKKTQSTWKKNIKMFFNNNISLDKQIGNFKK